MGLWLRLVLGRVPRPWQDDIHTAGFALLSDTCGWLCGIGLLAAPTFVALSVVRAFHLRDATRHDENMFGLRLAVFACAWLLTLGDPTSCLNWLMD